MFYCFAACDRFNVGDLLFPLVLNRFLISLGIDLKDISNVSPTGVIFPELAEFKGLSFRNFADISRNSNGATAHAIFSGGEVFGANWNDTLKYSLPTLPAYAWEACARVSRSGMEDLAKTFFGLKENLPWILPGNKNLLKVFYSTCGGSQALKDLSPANTQYLVSRLSEASFVSVRDQYTHEYMNSKGISNLLAPDSVCSLLEFFTESEIEEQTSDAVKNAVRRQGDYAFFQCSRSVARGKNEQLCKLIQLLKEEFGLTSLLVPMGTASFHWDQWALAELNRLKKEESFHLSQTLSVFETLYIMLNAKLYIGSSLHGTILSGVFSVPRLALGTSVKKQLEHLKSWDLPSFQNYIDLNFFSLPDSSSKIAAALSVSGADMRAIAKQMRKLALENLQTMAKHF